MIERVDYNRIASSYDERYSGNQLPGIAESLHRLAEQLKPKKILEVGCGTGRWLAEFGNVSIEKYGMDISSEMLRCSRNKSACKNLICADANHFPFSGQQFDLVYCINAIHHFPQKKGFIRSCKEILNKGGVLSITGFDPRNRNDNWYVYDYFEGTYKHDLQRYPSISDLKCWMLEAGYKNIHTEIAETVVNSRIGNDVFNDLFLRKDQASQLAMLTDSEYSAGIEKIKLAVSQNEETVFPVHLTFQMTAGNM